jgi:hypothetical protein
MRQAASDMGRKAVALAILAAAAWLLLKFVIGAITAVAWTAVLIVALIAVIWAVWSL